MRRSSKGTKYITYFKLQASRDRIGEFLILLHHEVLKNVHQGPAIELLTHMQLKYKLREDDTKL